MRILCLILASDGEPVYIDFQNQWRRYMNSHPDVDCVFYKGDPTLSEEATMPDNNTLILRCQDNSTHMVYNKTLLAFDYFLPKLDQYDFVYRPNLSSFIDFRGLVEWCKSLPTKKACSAVVGVVGGIRYPSGAGYVITPDLVRRFCAVRPPQVCMDDVTIGKSLADWGVTIIPAPRCDTQTVTDGHWHYRLRTDNRDQDIRAYRALVDFFYPTK